MIDSKTESSMDDFEFNICGIVQLHLKRIIFKKKTIFFFQRRFLLVSKSNLIKRKSENNAIF